MKHQTVWHNSQTVAFCHYYIWDWRNEKVERQWDWEMTHRMGKLQWVNNTWDWPTQCNRWIRPIPACSYWCTNSAQSLCLLLHRKLRESQEGSSSPFPCRLDPLHSGIWANILLYILNVFSVATLFHHMLKQNQIKVWLLLFKHVLRKH